MDKTLKELIKELIENELKIHIEKKREYDGTTIKVSLYWNDGDLEEPFAESEYYL